MNVVGFVPHKFRFPLPPLNPKNLNLNSVTPKTFSKNHKVQGLNETGESGVDLATSVLGYNVTRKRCKIYKINVNNFFATHFGIVLPPIF